MGSASWAPAFEGGFGSLRGDAERPADGVAAVGEERSYEVAAHGPTVRREGLEPHLAAGDIVGPRAESPRAAARPHRDGVDPDAIPSEDADFLSEEGEAQRASVRSPQHAMSWQSSRPQRVEVELRFGPQQDLKNELRLAPLLWSS